MQTLPCSHNMTIHNMIMGFFLFLGMIQLPAYMEVLLGLFKAFYELITLPDPDLSEVDIPDPYLHSYSTFSSSL